MKTKKMMMGASFITRFILTWAAARLLSVYWETSFVSFLVFFTVFVAINVGLEMLLTRFVYPHY